jgi:hypothetical protein
MNEDIENCYRLYIITSSLKTKLKEESSYHYSDMGAKEDWQNL